jgi:hypothetical protein
MSIAKKEREVNCWMLLKRKNRKTCAQNIIESVFGR